MPRTKSASQEYYRQISLLCVDAVHILSGEGVDKGVPIEPNIEIVKNKIWRKKCLMLWLVMYLLTTNHNKHDDVEVLHQWLNET